MLRLFVGTRSFFAKLLGWTTGGGLLGSRVGYVRVTWKACFDVRAKTRVVQICRIQRQVHLADVFDGGLFVIKLGRTKKTPNMEFFTWQFFVTFLSPSWRSLSLWKGHLTIPIRSLWITWHVILRGPGARWQATWFRRSTFLEDVSFGRQLKMSIPNPCAFWRWRGRGKNGFNMVQLGRSVWAWRSRFHRVVFQLTKLATICSWRARHSILLWWQGRIKGFWPWNTSSLTTFQVVSVKKKFWKLSRPQKCPKIRVCLRILREQTTLWGEFQEGKMFCPLLSLGWKLLPLLPCCILW